MYFDSFAEFLSMGRHGLYVWMSYGFFMLVLAWNLLLPLLATHRAQDRARQYWRRQQRAQSSSVEVENATH